MIRRPPRSTPLYSSAASDVYKRQPHISDSDCGKCHNTMTAGGGLVITDQTRHINGSLDVNGDQACNACHGSATGNAPPKDTLNNTATNTRGVGAHQSHLNPTNP